MLWLMVPRQVEDIVNTSGIFKGVLYFKSCEEPS